MTCPCRSAALGSSMTYMCRCHFLNVSYVLILILWVDKKFLRTCLHIPVSACAFYPSHNQGLFCRARVDHTFPVKISFDISCYTVLQHTVKTSYINNIISNVFTVSILSEAKKIQRLSTKQHNQVKNLHSSLHDMLEIS